MTEVKSAYWDKEVVISEIPSGQNVVKISLCTKKDRDWLAIREWYRTVAGELAPGKHGLAIILEGTLTVDSLLESIQTLKTMLP